jgi:hypothetical protein
MISLPQSLDSSTTRTDELASLVLSLVIQQNPHVGKVWLLTQNPKKTSGKAASMCCMSIWHCPSTPMAHKGKKVALFENWIKQNQVMEYQLIKLYQLNQA